ncbi:MAG: hypothetical protein FWF57_01430 [Defluviitaleaceae bacterium]|nr:hypothetical protein [Defluviitaleaceae bacterium]
MDFSPLNDTLRLIQVLSVTGGAARIGYVYWGASIDSDKLQEANKHTKNIIIAVIIILGISEIARLLQAYF